MSDPSNHLSPAPSPAPARNQRRWIRLAIGLPILAVVWWLVIGRLVESFAELDWSSLRIGWPLVGLSILALLCARLTNALNCRQVLGAMGQSIGASRVVPIIWVASLGRYVPGKFAVVAGAAGMLVRLGVRLPVALAALFLSTALMILIGLVASAPLLFALPALREKLPGAPAIALAGAAAGALCLHPAVFTRLCNVLLRRLKRQLLPERLVLGPFLRAVGMTVLRTMFLGLALWCAVRSLDPTITLASYPLALGSAGLASCIGFLAIFAPAGLGVHEAVYLLTVGAVVGPAAAVLVVLFRFLNILVDALTGAVGLAMFRLQHDWERGVNAAVDR
jgi:hypothetical protein